MSLGKGYIRFHNRSRDEKKKLFCRFFSNSVCAGGREAPQARPSTHHTCRDLRPTWWSPSFSSPASTVCHHDDHGDDQHKQSIIIIKCLSRHRHRHHHSPLWARKIILPTSHMRTAAFSQTVPPLLVWGCNRDGVISGPRCNACPPPHPQPQEMIHAFHIHQITCLALPQDGSWNTLLLLGAATFVGCRAIPLHWYRGRTDLHFRDMHSTMLALHG